MDLSPIQVIAVTSGKGGVGKTQVSTNLAIALARRGQRVALLDADLALANVDVALGVKVRACSADVFAGRRSLAEVVHIGPAAIKVVPSASGEPLPTPAQLAGLIHAFSEIASDLDVLIIDTARGIDQIVVSFACAAQEVLVVVCDEPTSVAGAFALIKHLHLAHGLCRFHILANMTRSPEEGVYLFRKMVKLTERSLDVALHYLGALPFDEQLRTSVRKQRAVVEEFPRSKCAVAFKTIANRVYGWPLPSAPRGNLEFFFERLL
ncbi:P-loop NTPase [Pseudomonas sp. GCM10022186]|uniref:P-loop NTPase n=1 Tax=Pseudomonas sp. GCM10022186 TaxID=3252650 RepID=UPI00361353E1